MKAQKLYDAITEVRDEFVEEAGGWKLKRNHSRLLGAVAALLAAVLIFHALSPAQPADAYAISVAQYPQPHTYPNEGDYGDKNAYHAAESRWFSSIDLTPDHAPYSQGLKEFWAESTRTVLTNTDQLNPIFSPACLYLTLAMSSEVTEGNTRQQLLDVLGEKDLHMLRNQANTLWEANYLDAGLFSSILANSMWLNEDISYQQEPLENLSQYYYASSFRGKMGSKGYDHTLHNWINEQTGGLLSNEAANLHLSPDSALALVSTVYFSARWMDEFQPEDTESGVFHGTQSDVDAAFMKNTSIESFYWADQFSAKSLAFAYNGQMWLVLPDEGVTPEALLADPQLMELLLEPKDWEQVKTTRVHLSLPKFDITANLNLTDSLNAMGITDLLDSSSADFSPLLSKGDAIALTQMLQSTRVAIDEQGCTAASFSASFYGSPMPEDEVDFILDRPFLFAITGNDGIPLFIGIVNQL